MRALLRGEGEAVAVVPSELRERLGISRKYLIPLLEWADSRGLTEWEGDVRRVRVRPPRLTPKPGRRHLANDCVGCSPLISEVPTVPHQV